MTEPSPDERPWVVAEPDAASARLSPVERLLRLRGILDTRVFFDPGLEDLLDPAGLLGMDAAVARIQRAVAAGEKILIYGDYDVDGTVAIVLLKTAIKRTAAPGTPARVVFHVPHRLREGYGMQTNVLGAAAADGVSLVISVDTGIRAFEAAEEARALGLDLIVTDHHLPDGVAGMPEAHAVINPAQPGCAYANKDLCGAAVAFKLAHALLAAAADTPLKRDRLERLLLPSFLKLVAVATIADSVALTGENRAFVMLGLRELANPVQPGLRALMEVAKLALDQSPTAREVGFQLAPRINAAGRMDVASEVVELFLTRDAERGRILAGKLDRLNADRRATEAAALEAIELQLLNLRDIHGRMPPMCLVLSHPEWHRGVLGILASRVVERTGRPALVMSEEDGQAHGSGRSIAGFHLLDALTAIHAGELFSRFGGHAHAVGFSLPAVRLNELRSRMAAHSGDRLTVELLTPPLVCDLVLRPEELTLALCRELARFAPFGAGHHEPVILTRGLRLAGPLRVIKERHVCLPICPNEQEPAVKINAMGWSRSGMTETKLWPARCAALGLGEDALIDIVYRLRENTSPRYGGLDLEMIDVRAA